MITQARAHDHAGVDARVGVVAPAAGNHASTFR